MDRNINIKLKKHSTQMKGDKGKTLFGLDQDVEIEVEWIRKDGDILIVRVFNTYEKVEIYSLEY